MSIINANATKILVAVHQGNVTRAAIIERTQINAGTVTAALSALKAKGFLEQGDEGYTVTADAAPYIGTGRMPRSNSKMASAREIVMKHLGKGRQVVLAKLVEMGLSEAGSKTYFQTLKSDPAVLAHQASLDAAKTPAPKLRKTKAAAQATA